VDITYMPAWYLHGIGRVAKARRSVSPFVYQAKVFPFQIQGEFEGVPRLFEQIKAGIVVFGNQMSI